MIERQFGNVKASYRGLAKIGALVPTLFAPSHVWMVKAYAEQDRVSASAIGKLGNTGRRNLPINRRMLVLPCDAMITTMSVVTG